MSGCAELASKRFIRYGTIGGRGGSSSSAPMEAARHVADGMLAAGRVDLRLSQLSYDDLLALASRYAQTSDGRRAVDEVVAKRATVRYNTADGELDR